MLTGTPLDLTPFGALLKGVGLIYWALAALGLWWALRGPAPWQTKLLRATPVVLLFGFVPGRTMSEYSRADRSKGMLAQLLGVLLLALAGTDGLAAGNTESTTRATSGWEIATEGGGGGTSPYEVGGDDPLCQQLRNYMNHAVSRAVKSCDATARLFDGFSDPAWKELNPRQHMSLIARLQRYAAEGAARYFDRTTVPERRPDAQRYYQDEAEKFVAGGGRLRLWVTAPYDPQRDDTQRSKSGRKPARPLIQLRSPAPSGCKESMSPEGLFFVTDDLQGPDPDVTDGFYSYQTIHLANGKRILLRDSPADVEVLREEGQLFQTICHLAPRRAPK